MGEWLLVLFVRHMPTMFRVNVRDEALCARACSRQHARFAICARLHESQNGHYVPYAYVCYKCETHRLQYKVVISNEGNKCFKIQPSLNK